MNNTSSMEAGKAPASQSGSAESSPALHQATSEQPVTDVAVTAAEQPGTDATIAPTPQVVSATPVIGAPPLPQTLGLTARQRIALQAIASGELAGDAAQMAGVDRSTLYRWRTKDENFIAALNAWRQHTRDSASDKLTACVDAAAGLVADVIRRGDVKTALTVLKSLGNLAPSIIGPTTALTVHQVMERDETREDVELLKARIRVTDDRDLIEGTMRAGQCYDRDDAFDAQQKKRIESLGQQIGASGTGEIAAQDAD